MSASRFVHGGHEEPPSVNNLSPFLLANRLLNRVGLNPLSCPILRDAAALPGSRDGASMGQVADRRVLSEVGLAGRENLHCLRGPGLSDSYRTSHLSCRSTWEIAQLSRCCGGGTDRAGGRARADVRGPSGHTLSSFADRRTVPSSRSSGLKSRCSFLKPEAHPTGPQLLVGSAPLSRPGRSLPDLLLPRPRPRPRGRLRRRSRR